MMRNVASLEVQRPGQKDRAVVFIYRLGRISVNHNRSQLQMNHWTFFKSVIKSFLPKS